MSRSYRRRLQQAQRAKEVRANYEIEDIESKYDAGDYNHLGILAS